ncbi:hypothetical protein [Pelagicoccus sp. SDUM812005]|uniref:hypothetical protein n=1 Tax=Pelagicoccus sp. SDUM812005 TaxID=3041257 RepID=UPI00280D5CBE|nr:hypothetical protein [Pelagicoccus sp. SDUM812005]MDQ8183775.1 hypothetical protein [Pelagicoccus sp. SDUM812005]
MESNPKDSEKGFWSSPVAITIATAFIGIIGTGIGALSQGYHETLLERQKFESNLIFKALEPEDPKERANYLKFLVETGLINSLDVDKINKLAEQPERIPGTRPALKLQTSDDILISKNSIPGGIEILDRQNWNSWGRGKDAFAVSKNHDKGRIMAFGHDDILRYTEANRKNLQESFKWLTESNESNLILFTASHCEWFTSRESQDDQDKLFAELRDWGYTVKVLHEPLSPANLRGAGGVVIGNAWGNFAPSELAALERYLSDGGGLFAVGLGWSWSTYSQEEGFRCENNNEGQDPADSSTYPMNKLLSPYGAAWTLNTLE